MVEYLAKAFPVVKTVQGSGQQSFANLAYAAHHVASCLITAFMSNSRKHAYENTNWKDGLFMGMYHIPRTTHYSILQPQSPEQTLCGPHSNCKL